MLKNQDNVCKICKGLNKNGPTVSQKRPEPFSSSNSLTALNDDIIFVNAGDTFKVQVAQNSGSTIAISTDGNVNFENILTIQGYQVLLQSLLLKQYVLSTPRQLDNLLQIPQPL